jgi:predicted transposase YbfD/YdcC
LEAPTTNQAEEGQMDSSTVEAWQEISANGVIYDLGSLYGRIEKILDPRKAHGKRYRLTTLIMIILLAKMCGKDNPLEIADWAKNHGEELVKLLKLSRSWMPHHNTIRRVFQNILDEKEFDRLAQSYSQQEQSGEGEVLAIDGKALRGTQIAGEKSSDYVLSVYDVNNQLVVAQAAVDIKENEIVAAPRALEGVSVTGKVVTGDALHTQRAISEQIVARGGHYLWPVKENQPQLYQDIEHLFAPDQPKPGFGKITTDFVSATKVNYGHGRLEKRTIQTSAMLNEYSDWPSLGQVYRLERKFEWIRRGKVYKTSSEIEYGISSLSTAQAAPAKILRLRRQHWLIETGLHYRRDVTFHEDHTRMTIGAAGRILATVHNLVLGLFKRAGYSNAAQARRYFEGHIDLALALLVSRKLHS